jgi:hypothetical protein
MSNTELARALEGKIRRVLGTERKREDQLSETRAKIVEASRELREDIERCAAAERALARTHKRLEELMSAAKSQEEDHRAARSARKALESLLQYCQLGIRKLAN